jgi:hypothetical protein
LSFWNTLEHQHIKPALRRLWPWRKRSFGGVRVHYMKHLDGGGSGFGQDYVSYLQGRGMPRQARVYEWCSGPAFIGFSLLGHGLAETLCLADINPEAVEVCRRTIADNRLEDRVAVYHSDNLKDIPASERWDLVVSNPPHFVDDLIGDLRGHDPDWSIHRGFLRQRRTAPEARRRDRAAGKQPRLHRRDVPRHDRAGRAQDHLRRSLRAAAHRAGRLLLSRRDAGGPNAPAMGKAVAQQTHLMLSGWPARVEIRSPYRCSLRILAFHSCQHDASAVAFDEYDLVAAVAEERLIRRKGWGDGIPWLAIDEVLRIAGWTRYDVDVIALGVGTFPTQYLRFELLRDLYYTARRWHGSERSKRDMLTVAYRSGVGDPAKLFRADRFRDDNAFRPDVKFHFANHHEAHALDALFFTDWPEALIYTADGVGDNVSYSIRTLKQGKLECHYGGAMMLTDSPRRNSLAAAYAHATEACGFRPFRHEGKLTGSRPAASHALQRRWRSISVSGEMAWWKPISRIGARCARP